MGQKLHLRGSSQDTSLTAPLDGGGEVTVSTRRRQSPQNAWRGILSAEEYVRGATLCHRNARRLLDDAILLFQSKRYAGAVSFSSLASEEGAKPVILALVYITRGATAARSNFWKEFEDHDAKSHWQWDLLFDAKGFRTRLADPSLTSDAVAAKSVLAREIATYVEILQHRSWSQPDAAITPDFCANSVKSAFVLLRRHWKSPREVVLRLAADLPNQDGLVKKVLREAQEWCETPVGAALLDSERSAFETWCSTCEGQLEMPPRSPR